MMSFRPYTAASHTRGIYRSSGFSLFPSLAIYSLPTLRRTQLDCCYITSTENFPQIEKTLDYSDKIWLNMGRYVKHKPLF